MIHNIILIIKIISLNFPLNESFYIPQNGEIKLSSTNTISFFF